MLEDMIVPEGHKINTTFINLQSDYGFKRSFGTRRFQNNVIKLIEAALGDEIKVSRLVRRKPSGESDEAEGPVYHNKELLPAPGEGKRIIYDVYFTLKVCKGDSLFKPRHLLREDRDKDVEHHFILEMQNVYAAPFEDRMTYYVSKILAEQGRPGWNYDLDPVILMGITDFDFPHLTRQAVQEFELRERTTGESLTKKLRMLFYSLRQVPEEWDECESELQRRLFLIKNMDKLDKNSKPYRTREYQDMFDSAESAMLAAEDVVLYSQSLYSLRETQAGLDFRYEEGREEGIAIGLERGIEQGIESVVRKMKSAGCDAKFISLVTGLSSERIEGI